MAQEQKAWVSGVHAANGAGILGSSAGGFGVKGESTGGNGVAGSSTYGAGVLGTSTEGTAGLFDISNPNSFNDAIFATNSGYGNGITAMATLGHGVFGIANDLGGAGLFGVNNAGGEAVVGRAFSSNAAAVVGRNDGAYAGVKGVNAVNNGTGILAQANVDGASNGNALVASLEGSASGNTAVFQANGTNVARIDRTGRGFFNGGTQIGGADVAELFEVAGIRSGYEPGDVLVISKSSDRKMEKSSKPIQRWWQAYMPPGLGVTLTEENAELDKLGHMVPMGVIGVIPTKVCLEGGPVERGDLLVSSSIPGVAMNPSERADRAPTGKAWASEGRLDPEGQARDGSFSRYKARFGAEPVLEEVKAAREARESRDSEKKGPTPSPCSPSFAWRGLVSPKPESRTRLRRPHLSPPLPHRPLPAADDWSFAEDYTIKRMQEDGKSWQEMSEKVGRPIEAIVRRYLELRQIERTILPTLEAYAPGPPR